MTFTLSIIHAFIKYESQPYARHLICNIPDSTFYLFPDTTEIYENLGCASYEDFRSKILRETGISFCTREHFGTPLFNEDRKLAYHGRSDDSWKDESAVTKRELAGALEMILEGKEVLDQSPTIGCSIKWRD